MEKLKNKNDPILSNPGFKDRAHAGAQWQDGMGWRGMWSVVFRLWKRPWLAPVKGIAPGARAVLAPARFPPAPSLPTSWRVKSSGAADAFLDLSSAQCAMGQP